MSLGLAQENISLLYFSALMLKCMIKVLGAEMLWAPGVSLCDGIAYEYAEQNKLLPSDTEGMPHDFEQDILDCARDINRRYHSIEHRTRERETIALTIFDSMKKKHGLSKRVDIHMPNQSFYTLDMNPAGTVNIRIIRSADGRVTGVAYMTEAEVKELFGDMYGDGEEDSEAATDDREGKTGTRVTETDETETDASDAEFPRKMTVAMPVCRIREGVGADSLVVGLLGEGETVTVLGKKEDADGRMWYLLDQESLPEKPELSVEECYIRGDLLKKK